MSQTNFAFVYNETIKFEDNNDNVTVVFDVKMANLGSIQTFYAQTATFLVTGGLAAMNSAIAAAVRSLYTATFAGATLPASTVAMAQHVLA